MFCKKASALTGVPNRHPTYECARTTRKVVGEWWFDHLAKEAGRRANAGKVALMRGRMLSSAQPLTLGMHAFYSAAHRVPYLS